MAEHPNAELLRRGYAAFQAGDLETVKALFADDIVWHNPGRNHLAGDYEGADATVALFLKEFEETDGTFRTQLHDVLGSDEHAVALAKLSAEKAGQSLQDQYVHVVHIENNKVTESWIFGENQALEDEFWG